MGAPKRKAIGTVELALPVRLSFECVMHERAFETGTKAGSKKLQRRELVMGKCVGRAKRKRNSPSIDELVSQCNLEQLPYDGAYFF